MKRDPSTLPLALPGELIVDNFAVGGGAYTGIEQAFGRPEPSQKRSGLRRRAFEFYQSFRSTPPRHERGRPTSKHAWDHTLFAEDTLGRNRRHERDLHRYPPLTILYRRQLTPSKMAAHHFDPNIFDVQQSASRPTMSEYLSLLPEAQAFSAWITKDPLQQSIALSAKRFD